MEIEILGCRGKIKASAPKYKNHSGFLIDEKLLIDVGEEAFLERKPRAIIFTHFHPDHAYFVFKEETFSPGIPHYGPEPHPLLPNLRIISAKTEILGYRIIPIPVIHAKNLKSFGYVVEKDGKRVFFTGDVAWIEKAHLKEIGQVDLIITEATLIQKGGRINRSGDKIYGHTGIPDLIRILSPLSPKLIFTHYGVWFYKNIDKSKEKLKSLEPQGTKIIPAFDGLKIKV
ncbi:MAG: MBL fold metallo-hydrolase [Salegentibacter sp.]|uniref:Ribonuclease BN, tRNA processing enzyme n=1 Tax=Salegentibacter flavus TaxID=287099 RepID=A0A1I5BBP1_9FLAO|nr:MULTISPECIES: MBL fold metallo-hydrolase [Salegentibacter]MDR9457272.1 MBL fold metallo-hydrolase [Salegentibacter sp.]SFN72125.1 Ribonuclease BN, tRNA processing enzyme [Salegentibacter flavus]